MLVTILLIKKKFIKCKVSNILLEISYKDEMHLK